MVLGQTGAHQEFVGLDRVVLRGQIGARFFGSPGARDDGVRLPDSLTGSVVRRTARVRVDHRFRQSSHRDL